MTIKATKNKSSLIYKIMLYIKLDCLAISAFVLVVSVIIMIFLSSQQIIDNSLSFNKQIMNQIDSIFNNMGNFSSQISLDPELESMINSYSNAGEGSEQKILESAKIKLKLKTLATRNENVIGLMLKTSDGQYFCSELNENEIALFGKDWFKKYKDAGYPRYFSAPFTMQNKTLGKNQVIAFCSPYTSIDGIKGDLITIMLFRPIQKIMDDVQVHSDAYVLLDVNNVPFYPAHENTAHPINLTKSLPYFSMAIPDNEFYDRNGLNFNFACISEGGGWKLVTMKSVVSLVQPLWLYFLLIIASVVLFYLLTIATILPKLNRQIKPLMKISNRMRLIKTGNFERIDYEKTGDEIEMLGESFNFMLCELQKYVDLIVRQESEKNHMKYSLLISQIDPHFIYNTLNTVTCLARKQRCDDIIKVNHALISILRDRLRVTDVEIYDTVEREIDVVNDYAIIQKYRFGDGFELEWNVDVKILDLTIPKNIIQPFVENALFHGIFARKDVSQKGVVRISIYDDNESMVVKVVDNGVGISSSVLKTMNEWEKFSDSDIRGKHIGVRNIQKRLNFLYGKNDCVNIESTIEHGTAVTVTLPHNEKSAVSYNNLGGN